MQSNFKNKDHCIYYSRFNFDPDLSGGDRRAIQIHQLLTEFDFIVQTVHRKNKSEHESFFLRLLRKGGKNYKIINAIEKFLVTNGDYNLWDKRHQKYFYSLRKISKRWANSVIMDENILITVVDDPIYFSPLIKRLKKSKIPIVGICHNIESLVPGQVEFKKQIKCLSKELNCLKLCDLVVTISREDYINLNNFKINALFFPYHPAEEIAERMLQVRVSRKSSRKKNFLLIGSAKNKPTQKGLLNFVRAWNDYHLERLGEKLLIAGYDTENLNTSVKGQNIKLLGALTNEELDHQLSTIKAVICYQEDGTGALTRIQEMLIAGVPVMANPHAARSYYNSVGVIEFSSFDEFMESYTKIKQIEDRIPIPNSPKASYLYKTIRQLNKQ